MSIGKAPELIALEAQSLDPFNFSDRSTVLSELKRLVDGHQICLVMTQAAYQETLDGLRDQLWQRSPSRSSELERIDRFHAWLEQLSVSILPVEDKFLISSTVNNYEQRAHVLTEKAHETRQQMYVISPSQNWQLLCEERETLLHIENLELLLERFIAESYMRLSNFDDPEEVLIEHHIKHDVLMTFHGPQAWTPVYELLTSCPIAMQNNSASIPNFSEFRIAEIQTLEETVLKVTPRTQNQLTTIFSIPLEVFLILTPGEGALTYQPGPFEDECQMDPTEWQASCILPSETEAVLTENMDLADEDYRTPIRYKLLNISVDPCDICDVISISPEKSEFGDYVNTEQWR